MADVKQVEEQEVCCGGPAPKESDACWAEDADAKAGDEGNGCGCGTTASCCG
jgi:hypothetical protein